MEVSSNRGKEIERGRKNKKRKRERGWEKKVRYKFVGWVVIKDVEYLN